MHGGSPRGGYAPGPTEEALQRGDLDEAHRLGWWGDEAVYTLVQSGQGGRLLSTRLERHHGVALGLDLSNHTGVASVNSIWPESSVAMDGRLQPGDVIRRVNGGLHFTCEAVVQALKCAPADAAVELEAVRPVATRTWCERRATIFAGQQLVLPFETSVPSVLLFSFAVESRDVCLRLARAAKGRVDAGGRGGGGDDDDAAVEAGPAVLLEHRCATGRSSVVLASAGQYVATWDNSYSFLTSKAVRYLLQLVPLSEWEDAKRAERTCSLDAEVRERKQRSRALRDEIGAGEARLKALRREQRKLEATLEEARAAREANAARLSEARRELKEAKGEDAPSGQRSFPFGKREPSTYGCIG